MRTTFFLILLLSLIFLSHITSAQWLTNGSSTYYSQGNVGINVSAPGKRLDVFGDMRIRGDVSTLNFYRTSTPGDVAYIQYDQNNLNFNIATSGKTLRFINGEDWTESMRIATTGYVGINVTSPGKRLDIFGDMRIRGDVSTLNFYRTSSPGDIAYIQYDQHNLNFNIATSGKTIRFINRENWMESMRITPYGSVGIGTTNPGSFKLAVEGKIGAREIQVTTASWADFVFLKDYRLRPLFEVETFINENGHLPEIPSAKEVEENGINLGEMDAKLLQKIEELTLYMIELKKENEEMKTKSKLLEVEIEKLKSKNYK